jgi:hypothetical protein
MWLVWSHLLRNGDFVSSCDKHCAGQWFLLAVTWPHKQVPPEVPSLARTRPAMTGTKRQFQRGPVLERFQADWKSPIFIASSTSAGGGRPALDENCHREERQRRGDLAPAQVAIFLLEARRRSNLEERTHPPAGQRNQERSCKSFPNGGVT